MPGCPILRNAKGGTNNLPVFSHPQETLVILRRSRRTSRFVRLTSTVQKNLHPEEGVLRPHREAMGYAREPTLSGAEGKDVLLPGCPILRNAKGGGTESLGFTVEGTGFSPCNMPADNKGFSPGRTCPE